MNLSLYKLLGSCVIMFSGVRLYCCVILGLCVLVHAVLSGVCYTHAEL